MVYVANISTQKEKKSKIPWFSGQIQKQNRHKGFGSAQEKRTSANFRVVLQRMLPKNKRVDKKMLERVFREGRSIHLSTLQFKYIKGDGPRVSVIAPKSIARLATKRNALRRQAYRALAPRINNLSRDIVGIFIFKKNPTEDVKVLENEIETIFHKIN